MAIRDYRLWKNSKGDTHNDASQMDWVVREFWRTKPSEYQEYLSSRRAINAGLNGIFLGFLAGILLTYGVISWMVDVGVFP